ncbi:MAG: hypothetical protein HY098_05265 [Nitrospinae bacterium]|nr:hypothetical protein [Nitrospinota bacterium]
MKHGRSRISALLVAALLVAVAACAERRSNVEFSIRRDRVLDDVLKNTRTLKVYRDLDTIFIADVLWYKPELRRAFVASLKEEGRINDEQAATMTDEISKKEGRELEFIVGFYTPDKSWNDLDAVHSMWRLALKGGGGEPVAPERIEKLRVDKMQDAWLFPFITPWKSAYRVTFARKGSLPGADRYALRLSSVVGEGSLVWEPSK